MDRTPGNRSVTETAAKEARKKRKRAQWVKQARSSHIRHLFLPTKGHTLNLSTLRDRPCIRNPTKGQTWVRFNLVESHRIQNPEVRIQKLRGNGLHLISCPRFLSSSCGHKKKPIFKRNHSEYWVLASEFRVRIHYCGSHPW